MFYVKYFCVTSNKMKFIKNMYPKKARGKGIQSYVL